MKNTIIVNVEMPVELKKAAKIKALETQKTFKQFLAEALEEKIKRNK